MTIHTFLIKTGHQNLLRVIDYRQDLPRSSFSVHYVLPKPRFSQLHLRKWWFNLFLICCNPYLLSFDTVTFLIKNVWSEIFYWHPAQPRFRWLHLCNWYLNLFMILSFTFFTILSCFFVEFFLQILRILSEFQFPRIFHQNIFLTKLRNALFEAGIKWP